MTRRDKDQANRDANQHSNRDGVSSLRIDGFDRFERIGSGGFSSVYSARQINLGRHVAIKVLTTDVSSPSDRRAFERECQALGLVSHHPYIVTIYNEAFTTDGRPCIVMELYGRNYRERLDEEGPLGAAEVLALGVKMSGALHSAHLDGVLHRDLKPHNIFLSSYGEPALGDFGISTVDDERSISAASGLSVAYAAPEVLEDESATVASDVYSLAATLYHLVEGAAPFASKQIRTTVRRILTEHPAPLTSAGASVELSRVLQRALAKDPADRYRSAGEFGEALRSVQAALGLDRTTMPLPQSPTSPDRELEDESEGEQTIRRGRGDADPNPRGGASDAPPVPPVPPVAPERPTSSWSPSSRASPAVVVAATDSSDAPELPGEQTIRRARRSAVPAPPASADGPAVLAEPSLRRRRLAMAAGAFTVLAVVGLALGLGGGGDEGPVAATTTAVTPTGGDSDFLLPLVAPSDIRVAAGDDGSVEVSFTPVSGAVSYEIVSVVPSSPAGQRFEATSSPVIADLALDDAPCWKLIVLGEGLQFQESGTVCHQD